MGDRKNTMALLSCFILGHEFKFIDSIERMENIPGQMVFVKKRYNVWACGHCKTTVQTPPDKKPKPNTLRKTLRKIDEIAGDLLP